MENKIYQLRKSCGMTQEQLAEEVGVARQTISKWELGETAPDIKQAQVLAQIFGITLNELVEDSTKSPVHVAKNNIASPVPWKKIVAWALATTFLCLAIFGVLEIASRISILNPQDVHTTVVISRQKPIILEENYSTKQVFCQQNKPSIMCELPSEFVADNATSGVYTNGNGKFVVFDAQFASDVANPLEGTQYISSFENKGYTTYIDMARASMYYDAPQFGIFSSKEQLCLVGGSKLLRQQLCAGRNAEYYEIDGGLTEDGYQMRVYGFALLFDDCTWQIVLKDFNDNYCFVTVKDETGLGTSTDTLAQLLSTICMDS